MKHEDAIRNQSVERYLLQEMTEDERRVFEEHFFECAICGVDVADGTRMVMVGPQIDPVPVPIPIPKRVWWLPAAAAASLILPLLGGQVGYQLAMRRHVPTELVRVVTLRGPSRAGTPADIKVVRSGDGVSFDVPSRPAAVSYAAVVTCGGSTQSTHDVSPTMAEKTVTLRIGELPAGRCEVVVQGVRKDGKRFWIISYPFQVGER